MNIVWTSVLLIGFGLMLFGNVNIAIPSMLEGGSKSIALAIKLWGIYSVWLGILKIVEETGLDKKLSKLFNPIIRFLIGDVDEYTKNQLSINLTSNLLGMGNACTPSGINAIGGLDRGSKYATSSMIMIAILNSTSLDVFPTTVIGLRVLAGSTSPSDIILPTVLATCASTLAGVLLVKLFKKIFKDK